MSVSPATSSSYFQVPRFSRGDLDEVITSMRPMDVLELSRERPDLDVPFFPFPNGFGTED